MTSSRYRDKYFWFIVFLILGITTLHYSNLMSKWEVHIFYRRLYYIPIILSAFKYRLKGGLFSSIIIGILYSPHLILYKRGISITSINQYLEIILFITIGIITGKLVELDYRKQKLLENKIIEITKLQNYTKNIVDSITSGVISVDNYFNITSINKEGKKIFNIDLSDSMNLELVKLTKENKLIDILTQVKIQKTPIRDVKIDMNINKKELYLNVNVFPLFDILNRIQGLVIVMEDRSKERNLEAQAIRADRLSAVGELASGVAHEIRNPMGIIKTISQVLLKEKQDKDTSEGLRIIVDEVDRANKVIESLLNYAKPKDTFKEKLFLNNVIEEIILITSKFVKEQNVIILKDFQEDLYVFGDKEKLKQVFINIIFNAVQAIDNSGEINIITKSIENWVNIKIIDNGIGINKEDINKIFNPFFTTKEEGTGLGLSIVNTIIEEHGGYITLDSTPKEGTRVDIYLPSLKEGENEKQEKEDINSR